MLRQIINCVDRALEPLYRFMIYCYEGIEPIFKTVKYFYKMDLESLGLCKDKDRSLFDHFFINFFIFFKSIARYFSDKPKIPEQYAKSSWEEIIDKEMKDLNQKIAAHEAEMTALIKASYVQPIQESNGSNSQGRNLQSETPSSTIPQTVSNQHQ